MSNRKYRTRTTAFLIAGFLAANVSSYAYADRDSGNYRWQKDDRKEQRQERGRRGGGISLDEAAAKVRGQTGGRVLSAETTSRRGEAVHRIKILLPSGRVRVYHVDAATGELR